MTYAAALRLLGRPVRRRSTTARCSTPTTPTTSPDVGIALAAAQDEHRLEHRLPRLRRPAGHGGERARDRGDRLRARARTRWRSASVNFYGRRTSATSRPTTRRSRTTSSAAIVGELETSADYGAARRAIRALNATSRVIKRGTRADAGQVRHLLHRHAVQPGGRAGARLHRRLHPPEPRRHRDGPGPLHQGGAGGGRGVPGRCRPGADHRDHDRARCPTPRRPPPPPAPTSTAWRRRRPRARSRSGWSRSPPSIGVVPSEQIEFLPGPRPHRQPGDPCSPS